MTGGALTFPVKTNKGREWVTIAGTGREYTTSDATIQAAIEARREFKVGQISIVSRANAPKQPTVPTGTPKTSVMDTPKESQKTVAETHEQPETQSVVDGATQDTTGEAPRGTPLEAEGDEDSPAVKDVTEYPEVTDINSAVAVLRGEPYNIHHLKLRTPAMIREQAAINKVSFPNLPME